MKRWNPVYFMCALLLVLVSCSRDPKVKAQQSVDQGNKFFAKGKFAQAAIMYRKALSKDARYGEAYYRLGLADLKLAAYGDAVPALRRAIELQPDNADAATKLADVYLLASLQDAKNAAEFQKDVQDLAQTLVTRDPRSFDGHRLLGQLALLKKDPPGAVKEFEIANAANPLQTSLVLSYFQALVLNNQFPQAEKLANDLIAKEKTYAPVYDALYLQYMAQKRFDDGERLLQLKLANNPQNTSYWLQLATHYFMVKRRDDMEAAIKKMTDEKKFPDGHLLAGDLFFFRLHELDRGRQEYEAAMKAFPKDKALYQKRLVELEATQGKNAEANQLLAAILKDNPKDSEAIAMRAALMLNTGNTEQIKIAANDLQALVTKTPQNYVLRFNLARALLSQNQAQRAEIELQEAVKLRPDFVAARELLARVYLADLPNKPGDSAKALQAADDLIAVDPNNFRAHMVRSGALINLQDRDKAQKELTFIDQAYPQNPDARYLVGYFAWQQKDYKKANQVFEDLYKINPKDPRGLMGIVETMASQNRLDEAIQQLEKASRAEPDRNDLKLSLANLYVRGQKYDGAIDIYKGLLQQNPKSPDLLTRLAETYRRKGDANAAIETFRRCTEVAPSDTRCLLQTALGLDNTGRTDQSQPIYEQILKIEPDHPIALNNLAYYKAEQGVDIETALTMAQRAHEKQPNSPAISDTLGWIYIRKNLPEEASRIYKDLVAKNPDEASFHYHYGMALIQKGDKPTAKKEFTAALKSSPPPNKTDRAKIQELLQSP